MKKKEKNPVGRPNKHSSISLEQVEKYAGLGLIDTEIAYLLNISEATLNNYKDKKHASYFPEFLESIKRGKLEADKVVVKSLYKRAQGHEYDEVHTEYIQLGTDEKPVAARKVKTVRKLVVAEVAAQIFWLKNRRPDLWRDKRDIGLGLEDPLLEKFKDWTPDEIRADQAKIAAAILAIERAGKDKAKDKPA